MFVSVIIMTLALYINKKKRQRIYLKPDIHSLDHIFYVLPPTSLNFHYVMLVDVLFFWSYKILVDYCNFCILLKYLNLLRDRLVM